MNIAPQLRTSRNYKVMGGYLAISALALANMAKADGELAGAITTIQSQVTIFGAGLIAIALASVGFRIVARLVKKLAGAA